MGDVRNLKTCLFKARISSLFERETPYFFFDLETRLADLAGTVLSEGRYILINETTFDFLCGIPGNDRKGGGNLFRMISRALPHDQDSTISVGKSVLYTPPFSLRIPDVPEGVKPSPPWCNQSRYVSLLNVKAFPMMMKHYAKKVIAFGASLNPPRSSQWNRLSRPASQVHR